MARSVPPLNPLHVFEVASRFGSFTKAAEVLSVSPSAVSRQIAALETFLDVRLFHRARDGNTLTEVGEEYYRGVAPAFETISSATDRVKRAQDNTPINVRVPPTFAVRFLLPRLSGFRAEYPNINLRITTGFGAVDFMREDVDISIQVGSGTGRPPNANCSSRIGYSPCAARNWSKAGRLSSASMSCAGFAFLFPRTAARTGRIG